MITMRLLPVAHMTTVWTLLIVSYVRHWFVSRLDVKTAFLNGELREVYMQPTPGYSILGGMVCHLSRYLYGLKQAPRAWFERFASVVIAAGFLVTAHDPALFVHLSARGRILLLYVDDMIIIGNDPVPLCRRDLVGNFLLLILALFGTFSGLRSLLAPMPFLYPKKSIPNILLIVILLLMSALLRLPWSSMFTLVDPTHYRHFVGSLVYLVVTRLDISYPVHILSQFVSAPTLVHYSHLLISSWHDLS